MRRNTIQKSRELVRPRRSPSRLPHLFGRGGRDRALIALAVNGPMHVRELARVIGSDSHKTFDMVEGLRQAGVVVKRDVPGYRKTVALNRCLDWAYWKLRDLLFALDAHWPAGRLEGRIQPREMWGEAVEVLGADQLDRLFQSPVRSRTLLFVAAVGVTDMTTLIETLGLGSVSALYAVNHWEREGVVRSRVVGRHRLVSLDPGFVVAQELGNFLVALVQKSPEYLALGDAARPRIEEILRPT